ncbi:hypothetical protein [Chloroflexus sp.]|uniref:hypothetical protein n=1 Tax=Chloroflexus sp. TaxID=1904827 RepID=UPI00262EDF8A|nr:hypothetical protein [uncultured Chloroflexus sp.]
MGLYIGLISLIVSAGACFALTHIGLTRRLGLLAALAATVATTGVIFDPIIPAVTEPITTIGAVPIWWPMSPDLSERAPVIMLLFGGAIGLLALALAAPPDAEGFGALFGWLLLALTAACISLTIPPLSFLTPLSWALAILATHGALISSGAIPAPAQLPPHLVAGAIAVAAVCGIIAMMALLPPETLPEPALLALAVIGALAIAGAPPFAGTRFGTANAPALISTLTVGLVLPTIGLGFIVRLLAQLPPLPPLPGHVLAAIGALGSLGAAIGALRSTSGRELVLWQGAFQAGVIVCAAAISDPLASLAAPALLPALQLHALAGGLIIATIEQRQGSDALDGSPARRALPFTGILWIFTTATAIGLPIVWSFWGWRWLIEALTTRLPWIIAPLIAAAVINMAAGLPLLIRCWYGKPGKHELWPENILAVLILAPLTLAGLIPWLAWPLWLSWSPFAPPVLPADPIAWPLVGLVLSIGLGGWFLARQASLPYASTETDHAVIPTWYGLGEILHGLTEFATGRVTLNALGRGLDRTASMLHIAMIIFEQRYYLFGVIIALLIILVLMAQ